MAIRGRKRKAGERYPSGDLKPAAVNDMDRARRAALTEREDGSFGPPEHSTFPLGRLFASGGITQEQFNAGCRFAWLFAAAISKKPTCTAISFDPSGHGLSRSNPEAEARNMADYRGACEALQAHSRAHLDAISNLCIYERSPRWMLAVAPRLADVAEAGRFMAALTVLTEHFGLSERRAA